MDFPCAFTIKVFGAGSGPAGEQFEAAVLMIIRKHVPNYTEAIIPSRASENSKYRALSITIQATSQEQLDSIYQDLSSSPHVLMAL